MSSSRPPAAIKTKTAKLDFAPLHAAYEWMAVDKPAAFRMAFDWYGLNVAGLLRNDPFDAERQKSYDRAVKAKALGDQAGTKEEALHAWTTALRLYEAKVWPGKNLPPVEPVLTAPPTKRVVAVMNLLSSLNKAYSGHVSFESTPAAAREYRASTVLLPVAELHAMATQPVLKAVLGEAVTVAKMISVKDGKLDGATFMATLPLLLASVAETVEPAKAPKISSPAAPRAPKAPVVPGGADRYIIQSKKAALLVRIQQGDTVSAIASALNWSASTVKDQIKRVARQDGLNISVLPDGRCQMA